MKKIHISFSAGETSAWMTYYLLKVKYKCKWDDKLNLHVGTDEDTKETIHIAVTFANTGQENEETLAFAKKCDEYFGFNTVWLECVTRFKVKGVVMNVIDNLDKALNTNWFGSRLGTRHRIVNFETANRDGLVYESVIARYGLPNNVNQFCTRELKLRPMTSYLRSIKWKRNSYYSAIGIRIDEIDRVNSNREELKLIYPAISMKPMTKPQINGFWQLQPFRLNLKGYQGHCKRCCKKHDRKLWQLGKETPETFNNLACVSLLLNELEKAKKLYEEAIKLFPDYYDAIFNLKHQDCSKIRVTRFPLRHETSRSEYFMGR